MELHLIILYIPAGGSKKLRGCIITSRIFAICRLSAKRIQLMNAHPFIVGQLPRNRWATAVQSLGNCRTIVGQLPDDI